MDDNRSIKMDDNRSIKSVQDFQMDGMTFEEAASAYFRQFYGGGRNQVADAGI